MNRKKDLWIFLLFRKIKLAIIKIYRSEGSSHEIALGASIGAFWGVFPTFGLSTILIIILYKFIRFNLITAFAGALISNPITSPFLLFLSYQVGNLFITSSIIFQWENWLTHFNDLVIVMLVGSGILSSFTALIVYLITFYLIRNRLNRATQTQH